MQVGKPIEKEGTFGLENFSILKVSLCISQYNNNKSKTKSTDLKEKPQANYSAGVT